MQLTGLCGFPKHLLTCVFSLTPHPFFYAIVNMLAGCSLLVFSQLMYTFSSQVLLWPSWSFYPSHILQAFWTLIYFFKFINNSLKKHFLLYFFHCHLHSPHPQPPTPWTLLFSTFLLSLHLSSDHYTSGYYLPQIAEGSVSKRLSTNHFHQSPAMLRLDCNLYFRP